MSNYYNRNNRRKKRTRREKIGFYTAFSICLIAVCMAVYSTYNTISSPIDNVKQTDSTRSALVNQYVTGVTESRSNSEDIFITLPSQISDETIPKRTNEPSEKPTGESDDDALQTMLSADVSLTYPVKNPNVVRGYSKESTYFKTLNVWKPHTGVDFEAELGDDVYAMNDGEVTKVFDDKMFGKSIEISANNVIVTYSGLGSVDVKKGDNIKAGEKIGSVGAVPFEASDKTHIHISLRVNGKYADPLSFIGNNE